MCVPEVDDAVVIVVIVEVILSAVAIEIAWPSELIDAGVVIVVLIVGATPAAIDVFIGDAVVIVIHQILID